MTLCIRHQECVGNSSPTRMECFTPAFPRDEMEEGELSFDMDGALGLWNKEFSYHPYGEPIPFETEGHVLSLYPGFDEVSLHVREPSEALDGEGKRFCNADCVGNSALSVRSIRS